jgi:hypothetical protein
MSRSQKKLLWAGLGIWVLSMSIGLAFAEPSKVGNGDDGSDLEGFTEIKKGPIVEARKEAVQLVRNLNTAGVPGLGMLLPEVEGTRLYLTKKDVSAVEDADAGTFHADMKSRVYARTFAEPHAATRFFPVAEKLDRDQLVALHIHEALHRSLPASIREDESKVSTLTLAITSPGASYDSIQHASVRVIPEADRLAAMPKPADNSDPLAAPALGQSLAVTPKYPVPEQARIKNPSEFRYSFRKYRESDREMSFPVNSMHVIGSDLYPFGSEDSPIGIGIEASFIQRPQESLMGPLSLSARGRLWSRRGFDVGYWGVLSLNTLSAEELKNSQYGRDTFSLGLSLRKDLSFFSIENFLGYTFAGKSQQRISSTDYTYNYGGVVTVSLHPAALIGPAIRLGAFVEMNLGEDYTISGGSFSNSIGRYRLLSGGPEVQYFFNRNVALGLSGRFVIDSTKDADFDMLGDLMGPGVAQGNVTGTLSFYF